MTLSLNNLISHTLAASFGLAVWLVAGAGAAHANGYDSLLRAVPQGASGVVGVNYEAMRKHVHYEGLFKFLNSQGYARPLLVLKKAGIEPGKHVKHAVSFQMGGRNEAMVLTGKLAPKKLSKFAKKTLAKGFKQGQHEGKTWFTLSKALVVADAGGGRVLVGPLKLVKASLTALSQGKNILSRAGFKALRKEAAGSDAVVWSVSYIPNKTRAALRKSGANDMAHVETSTMKITGSNALMFKMVGHTRDAAGASEVAKALNGKIDRKIYKNALLNALVGHLVRQLTIVARGKVVTGKMKLTAAQVAVVAKYGARAIKILR